MSKKEELENLFIKWKLAHNLEPNESLSKTINGVYIDRDFFEIDGIIDEKAFSEERIKVLFISAEANANEYNAKKGIKETDYRKTYSDYFDSGKDDWKGKMRERLSAIYGCITNQTNVPFHTLANKFAVLDLNKRGGESTVDGGEHIKSYVEYYKEFIIKEIKIINPDLIVWVGLNICRLGIPSVLGFGSENNILFYNSDGKKIPAIVIWQTSYYQAKIDPLPNYKNRVIGKLCAKAKMEIDILNASPFSLDDN